MRKIVVTALALGLVGCTIEEPSRTFQTSTMLCTESGATATLDGEQLAEVIAEGGKIVPKILMDTLPPEFASKGQAQEKGKSPSTVLKDLLTACKEFLSDSPQPESGP